MRKYVARTPGNAQLSKGGTGGIAVGGVVGIQLRDELLQLGASPSDREEFRQTLRTRRMRPGFRNDGSVDLDEQRQYIHPEFLRMLRPYLVAQTIPRGGKDDLLGLAELGVLEDARHDHAGILLEHCAAVYILGLDKLTVRSLTMSRVCQVVGVFGVEIETLESEKGV